MPAPTRPTARRRYTQEDVQKALDAIKGGVMTLGVAAKSYGVLKTTLHDKLHGRYKEEVSVGRPSVLSNEEEEAKTPGNHNSLNFLENKLKETRNYLAYIEAKIGLEKVQRFSKGDDVLRDEGLYDLWKSIKDDVASLTNDINARKKKGVPVPDAEENKTTYSMCV